MPPSRHHSVGTGFAVEDLNVMALIQTEAADVRKSGLNNAGRARRAARNGARSYARASVVNPAACGKKAAYGLKVLKDGKKFSFIPQFMVARARIKIRVRVRVEVSLCLCWLQRGSIRISLRAAGLFFVS